MSMLNAAAELTRRAATASFMVKISLACRRSGMVTMLTKLTKIKVISGGYQTTAPTGSWDVRGTIHEDLRVKLRFLDRENSQIPEFT